MAPRSSFSALPNLLRRAAVLVASLSVALLSSSARAADEPPTVPAAEPDAPTPPPAKEHDDVLVTAAIGGFADADNHMGGVVTATALRQHGAFAYGGTFEYGGAVFDYTVVTAAPMAGVFVPAPSWLRVGVAATAGIHSYDGVGQGFLSDDPGTSGVTGFVGARAFAGVEAGGKARFHIGFQLAADEDLTRIRHSYTYEESSLFGNGSHSELVTHSVGTFRFATMLAMGTAFDL